MKAYDAESPRDFIHKLRISLKELSLTFLFMTKANEIIL